MGGPIRQSSKVDTVDMIDLLAPIEDSLILRIVDLTIDLVIPLMIKLNSYLVRFIMLINKKLQLFYNYLNNLKTEKMDTIHLMLFGDSQTGKSTFINQMIGS